MALGILRRGQFKYLSILEGFYNIVWFPVAFEFFWDILFLIFSFIYTILILQASNIPKYLYISFSPRVLIFSCLGCPILRFCVVYRFSLLAWHIFLWQIPSLCSFCIFSLLVLGFPILFHFWQKVWCSPCILVDWSFWQFTKFVSACVLPKYML